MKNIIPSLTIIARCALTLSVIFSSVALMAQDAPSYTGSGGERSQYEGLGLTMREWEQIKEAGLSIDKVHHILEAGVSISEYFQKPWVPAGLLEDEWMRKRRAGLSTEDISAMRKKSKANKEWAVVGNLFVPGLHQLKRHDLKKGMPMASVAGISLIAGGLALAGTLSGKTDFFSRSYPLFLFVVLPADMLWSAIDIHLTIQKECNPEASRFSLSQFPGTTRIGIQMTLPIL